MKATKHKSTGTRIILSCLVVAVVLGVSYLVYYLINYTFNKKYEKYLLGTSYEAGTAYKAMADSNRPDGLPESQLRSIHMYYPCYTSLNSIRTPCPLPYT